MTQFSERPNPTPFNASIEPPLRTRSGAPIRWRDFIIDTDRLTLAPLTDRHALLIFAEYTPEIAKFMVARPPGTLAEAFDFVSRERELMRRGAGFSFAISHSRTGEFLGVAGLHRWDRAEEPAITVWIKSTAHQRGFGREAVTAVCDWAFEHFAYSHLCYAVDCTNIPSIKIAKSLGGNILATGTTLTESGRLLEGVIYSIPRPNAFEALRLPPREA